MAVTRATQRGWSTFLRCYGGIALLLVAFMELSTPAFIAQYDSRPNYLFVEYLGYAKEVGGTLLKDHWPHLLATAMLLPALGWAYARLSRPVRAPATIRVWQALPLSLLLFAVLALCARGALGHRPANPASVAVTTDHLGQRVATEFALHGGVRGLPVAQERRRRHHLRRDARATCDRRRAARNRSACERLHGPRIAHAHLQTTLHPRAKPLNLVVVLEESLGTEFVGPPGWPAAHAEPGPAGQRGPLVRQPLRHRHTLGARHRGGGGGLPADLGREHGEAGEIAARFLHAGEFLKPKGYESTFFYGGESHFDNMRGYFMGNGFDRVVEQKDMPSGAFIGTWGASDGDLFEVAHQHFSQQSATSPSSRWSSLHRTTRRSNSPTVASICTNNRRTP